MSAKLTLAGAAALTAKQVTASRPTSGELVTFFRRLMCASSSPILYWPAGAGIASRCPSLACGVLSLCPSWASSGVRAGLRHRAHHGQRRHEVAVGRGLFCAAEAFEGFAVPRRAGRESACTP